MRRLRWNRVQITSGAATVIKESVSRRTNVRSLRIKSWEGRGMGEDRKVGRHA